MLYCPKCGAALVEIITIFRDGPRDDEREIDYLDCNHNGGGGAIVIFEYLDWCGTEYILSHYSVSP
jgi:hypothetical protein